MTLGNIDTQISFLSNTDTEQYPASQRLIHLNMWLHKVVSMIFSSQDESQFDDARATDYPIFETSMVAGQRDYTFPVSEKLVAVRRVDITYDGTNWYRALPMKAREFDFGLGNDTVVDGNFTVTNPAYDYRQNAVFVYPMATSAQVAAGAKVRVEYDRLATEFTSDEYTTGTVVPGFEDTFHNMLALGAAYEYTMSKGLPQADRLKRELQEYEQRLRDRYSTKAQDRDYQLMAQWVNYK